MGMLDAFQGAIGGIDQMGRTRMGAQQQGFSQQLQKQFLDIDQRRQQIAEQDAQRKAEEHDHAVAQHIQEIGATPVISGMVKRTMDMPWGTSPGQSISGQFLDKADPSRIIKHKTASGEEVQFELPTMADQIARQMSNERQIKSGQQETADYVRNTYGKKFTPEDKQRYNLPDVIADTPLMANERVQVGERLPAMEQQALKLTGEKRDQAVQELSGMVDPATGQIAPEVFRQWSQKYPQMQAPPAPVPSWIKSTITSGVPIEKQPDYLLRSNLATMKPEDFDARVDALKLPSELGARTKQLVQQAIQLGDRKGALAVIKDASDQMGKTETAVRTAQETKPMKIEIAGAMANARAPKPTDGALDIMAWDAINGKEPSSKNPILYARVKQRQAEILKEQGMDAQAGIVERNAAKANNEAYSALNKQYTLLKPFAEMAEKNADLLEKRMSKVTDLGAPFLNSPIRSVQYKFTGNTNVAAVRAALLPVQADFARILNSPDAKGVLSDHARKEMEGAIGDGATVGQIKEALDVFRQDARSRKESYEANLADLKKHTVVGGGKTDGPKEGGAKATHRFNPATGKIEVIP